MQTAPRTLTHEDLTRLMRQALFAEDLVERTLGRALVGGATDLALLDELLDRGLVTRDDHYALLCLGVVIGSCLLEDMEGLTWFVPDEKRNVYLLQDPSSGRLISPLAMLEARLACGVPLARLYDAARGAIRPRIHRAQA